MHAWWNELVNKKVVDRRVRGRWNWMAKKINENGSFTHKKRKERIIHVKKMGELGECGIKLNWMWWLDNCI